MPFGLRAACNKKCHLRWLFGVRRTGTRLHLVTKSLIKKMLPIYEKPITYYSDTTQMPTNTNDILVISRVERISLLQTFIRRYN